MGLRSWWKSRQAHEDKDYLEWAENAQQDTPDEVRHADIDELRLDVGPQRLGEGLDDSRYD
jgi:hypothetical protein